MHLTDLDEMLAATETLLYAPPVLIDVGRIVAGEVGNIERFVWAMADAAAPPEKSVPAIAPRRDRQLIQRRFGLTALIAGCLCARP
jgi:hypothetical protein